MSEKGRERRGSCPICGAPTGKPWRPFCSRRCANVDLNRWLKGAYAVPVVEPDEDDDEALEAGPGAARRRSEGEEGSG
jgi:hypothetical protein